jgi:RNA polymerase sigma-70 factor, ECF subfamily
VGFSKFPALVHKRLLPFCGRIVIGRKGQLLLYFTLGYHELREKLGNIIVDRESNTSEQASSSAVSDWECVQKAQNGDHGAFDMLYDRYEKPIFNHVFHMLNRRYDDASEITQDVFLSAFRAIKQFRGDSKFSTWLYQIANNAAKTRGGALSKERKLFAEPLLPTGAVSRAHVVNVNLTGTESLTAQPSGGSRAGGATGMDLTGPEKGTAQKQDRELVWKCLERLSDEHREILKIIDMQSLSYEEAAIIVGIPINTVKTRLHRARLALANIIGAAENG